MNIAFDLDDTLLPLAANFETEGIFISKFFYKLQLRNGAYNLFKKLREDGHRVWIYTRSHRSIVTIKTIFLINGLFLDGVVNSRIHHREIKKIDCFYEDCYKYPPMFGIDILIDDGKFFFEDSQKYNFNMVLLEPTDKKWTETVLQEINKAEQHSNG